MRHEQNEILKFIETMRIRLTHPESAASKAIGMITPTILKLAEDLLDEIRIARNMRDLRAIADYTADVASLMMIVAKLEALRPVPVEMEVREGFEVAGKAFEIRIGADARIPRSLVEFMVRRLKHDLGTFRPLIVAAIWDYYRAAETLDLEAMPVQVVRNILKNSLVESPAFAGVALDDLPLDRITLSAV